MPVSPDLLFLSLSTSCIYTTLTILWPTLITDGGWLKTHSIPSDRGVYGSFNALQDSNRKIILEVLEGENEKPKKDDSREELAEKENLAKLRRGYRACLDEASTGLSARLRSIKLK